MGNSVSIGRDCLPLPENQELMTMLPFTWKEQIHENCYAVFMPDDWYLKDSSSRADLVNIKIVDPSGKIVAQVYGKTASYDFHVSMQKPYKEETIDLTSVRIKNGYLFDKNDVLMEDLRRYRQFCTSVNGYNDKQVECDAMYEVLKKKFDDEGEEIPISRIKLSAKSPLEGAALAMSGTTL